MSDAVEAILNDLLSRSGVGDELSAIKYGDAETWQEIQQSMAEALAAADKARAVTDEEVIQALDVSEGLGKAILDDLRERGMKVVRA